MIDMDDVICGGGLLHLINEYLQTNYTEDDCKGFYQQDLLPDKEAFFKWFITKNLYDYCTINEGAIEVIEELNKHYEVIIGTSYIFKEIPKESAIILYYKHNWLMENLPFISPHQYIFVANKKVLDCDIKIDDRIDNLDGAETKLLFTAFHNKDISDEKLKEMNVERMNSWYDIKERLIDNEGL